MLSVRGFTLFELLLVMAMIGIMSAVAIPTLSGSTQRNQVWTASELIGAQIRQARLKAISRNMSFRVRFDCPSTGQFRVLQVMGTSVDTQSDRCSLQQTYDSGVMTMPTNVTYSASPSMPTLTVNSRGIYTSSGTIPADITVTYGGGTSRTLRISATGQITFGAY